MIALFLLLSTNHVFAEPLSIEEMRPAQNTSLPNFRKYRKVEGPYSFVGYGLQLTPLQSRTAFSISHQLIRVNKRSSFEFGLRLGKAIQSKVYHLKTENQCISMRKANMYKTSFGWT